jgi:hypothetical protein
MGIPVRGEGGAYPKGGIFFLARDPLLTTDRHVSGKHCPSLRGGKGGRRHDGEHNIRPKGGMKGRANLTGPRFGKNSAQEGGEPK